MDAPERTARTPAAPATGAHPAGQVPRRDLRRERLALAVRSGLDDPAAGAHRRERLAGLVDTWLADVWVDATTAVWGRRTPPGVALAAVGGQARRDAGPAGDLDLVLLHDGRSADGGELAALADRLWYPVWDAGLRLDHSVRSLGQCREVAAADVPAAIGMLDLRPLGGDGPMVLQARESLREQWRRHARRRLPELLDGVAERTRLHGELAYLLEPDLKEARGGLRDGVVLQAVAASWLADAPHRVAGPAYLRLLDVRDALQVVTGRPGERLTLADQDAVAVTTGLPDADALLADVAAAARALAWVTDQTLRRARGAAATRPGLRRRRPRLRPVGADGADLVEHDGEVCLGPDARPGADAALAVRAAATAARLGLPLSPVTAEHLSTGAAALPDPWPAAAREALLDLLGSGDGLVPVWETLDQAGLVTCWFPEWRPVRNRPQRTVVHRHTVDRHLVQTCVVASGMLDDVARPDVLLLAALLHDIGKVPGAVDHAGVGAPVAYRCARRLGLDRADAEVVERLVREHLTLVELATRRDPDDPRTLQALVAAVDGREDVLDLLRALTEADARAAGPLAWTAWRRRLVDDLVARSRVALRGSPPPAPTPPAPAERELVAAVRADGDPRVQVVPLDGLHAVTVVAPDRPGLFADCAGLLAAHGLLVRSALVRTLDGVAVDTWSVQGRGRLPDPAALRTGLVRMTGGDHSVLERLTRREASWRPERSAGAGGVRVLVLPGAAQDATVVEVRAPDRPGLLHALGAAVHGSGAQVRSAHVATHAGRAVDVLYLTGPGAGPLEPAATARAVAALGDAAEPPSTAVARGRPAGR
ncbi:[protein-PII] uridylyltransferase [Thalassiella azotivora]